MTLHPPHLPHHTHSSPQISPSGLSTSRQIPTLRPLAGSPAGWPVSCQSTWSVRSSHTQWVRVGVSSCFFPSLTFSLLLQCKKPCQWESLLVTLVLSARSTLSPPGELQGLSESRPAPCGLSPHLCGWDGMIPRQGVFKSCPRGSNVQPGLRTGELTSA